MAFPKLFSGISARLYPVYIAVAVVPVSITGLIGIHFSIQALREEVLSHVGQEVGSRVETIARFMERALILAGGARIRAAHLPKELRTVVPCLARTGADMPFALADVERLHIQRVLEHCQGNKTKAAGLLGITRLTLRNKIGQYAISAYVEDSLS